jgi:signal transduction histidine kinase
MVFMLFSKELIPFDAVVVGTLDRDIYTPLATNGFGLACLPRRETLCSHTINQPGGSVLTLADMPSDPRFAHSPYVSELGLVSYAGTPLRFSFSREDGVREEVNLGTLCGVNLKSNLCPNELQKRAMVHCADTIVREIIEHARNTRAANRDKMASRLSALAGQVNAENAVDLVLRALRETYPNADVSFQTHPDRTITLAGIGPVPYAHFENHLYEDSAHIEAEILANNHLPTAAVHGRTLRAVAVNCLSASDTFLVVQSAELANIFDDVDGAFVYSCSLIVCNVRQAAELERVTTARINFLRGISHELRTPIHALLSSCEMLAEDSRATRDSFSTRFASGVQVQSEYHAPLLENALVSSRALMNTVNRLLNFDALTTILPVRSPFTLAALEAWLLDHANAQLHERRSPVELVCEHLLPPDVHVLNEDLDLLKQALCALLDNAISFTDSGTITFRSSLCEGALVFDVIDTGYGIAPVEHDKIFHEFQKGRAGSPGAGLGLTVARKIARALNGDVELKHSGPKGSWFRLRIDRPALAGQKGHPSRRIGRNGALLGFAVPSLDAGPAADALRGSLDAAGLRGTSMDKASLVILDARYPQLSAVLTTMRPHQSLVLIHRDEDEPLPAAGEASAIILACRTVKVRAPVGAEAMWTALEAALDLRDQLPTPPPLSRASTSTSVDFAHTRSSLRLLIVDDNV